DRTGVLAHITRCLSDGKINIAFTKLYREKKGEIAYTIIEMDEKIPEPVLLEIESSENIISATLIEM
ncbi:MAG: L-serine ammonia-lyase, iron-sulfur-dependent, subunit beta, partial [Eubacterium sp.]